MKELDNYEELDEYLRSKNRVFCIIEKSNYEEFRRRYKTEVCALDWGAPYYGKKRVFAVISNRCD